MCRGAHYFLFAAVWLIPSADAVCGEEKKTLLWLISRADKFVVRKQICCEKTLLWLISRADNFKQTVLCEPCFANCNLFGLLD